MPYERFQPITEEYKNQRKKQYREYEAFESKLRELDETLLPSFQKLYDQLFLDIPIEQESAFICGFRMGARIMMEIMEESI